MLPEGGDGLPSCGVNKQNCPCPQNIFQRDGQSREMFALGGLTMLIGFVDFAKQRQACFCSNCSCAQFLWDGRKLCWRQGAKAIDHIECTVGIPPHEESHHGMPTRFCLYCLFTFPLCFAGIHLWRNPGTVSIDQLDTTDKRACCHCACSQVCPTWLLLPFYMTCFSLAAFERDLAAAIEKKVLHPRVEAALSLVNQLVRLELRKKFEAARKGIKSLCHPGLAMFHFQEWAPSSRISANLKRIWYIFGQRWQFWIQGMCRTWITHGVSTR